MKDLQAQVPLKGLEVSVIVQQKMPSADAERRHQAIDGRANRDAALSQEPIALGALNGQVCATRRVHSECQQDISDILKLSIDRLASQISHNDRSVRPTSG